MRPSGVVRDAPRLDGPPCIWEREKPVLVQALVSEAPVEALDVGVELRATVFSVNQARA